MTTAKHRALDVLRRERTAIHLAPEISRLMRSEWTLAPVMQEFFEPKVIQEDQLRMMFSCCHPRLPEDAQVALILNILCGFSVDEVAAAFVSGHAATEKRITRAKKVLASSKKLFDVTDVADFAARLPAVQRALYLLFNEGYHGASAESAVRADLCREAMRLSGLLLEHPLGSTPATMRWPRSCACMPPGYRAAWTSTVIYLLSSIRIARAGIPRLPRRDRCFSICRPRARS